MAAPVLIDTDLGIDDAVAVSLALASEALDVQALVGVGGNVDIDQVMRNIWGLLAALAPPNRPAVGRGMDPRGPAGDRRGPFGSDGLGDCGIPASKVATGENHRELYRRCIESAGGELTLLMLGPLTNLADILYELPTYRCGVRRVLISGGAVWVKGNATPAAEFNFHRDPESAAKVLASGLPITVCPLDVSRLVCLDESHTAHMAASGYRTGQVLAKILSHAIEHESEPGYGKTHLQDALAAGSLIWPNHFLKTKMRLDLSTEGKEAGRCKPLLGGDPAQRVDLLTAVNAVDFLEDLLEALCHEAFVV